MRAPASSGGLVGPFTISSTLTSMWWRASLLVLTGRVWRLGPGSLVGDGALSEQCTFGVQSTHIA